jgi:hypothetical protein
MPKWITAAYEKFAPNSSGAVPVNRHEGFNSTRHLFPGAANDFRISDATITTLNGSFDAGTILADNNY